MNLIKRNNFLPSSSLFDDFLTRDLFDGWNSEGGNAPRVNIVETNDDFIVEMAAPGRKKEDFQVELDNDMLTISSDVSDNVESNNGKSFTRKEFSYRAFRRSFYLPNSVEAEKIEGRYKDGILKLVIPKKEEAKRKPAKIIAIS